MAKAVDSCAQVFTRAKAVNAHVELVSPVSIDGGDIHILADDRLTVVGVASYRAKSKTLAIALTGRGKEAFPGLVNGCWDCVLTLNNMYLLFEGKKVVGSVIHHGDEMVVTTFAREGPSTSGGACMD